MSLSFTAVVHVATDLSSFQGGGGGGGVTCSQPPFMGGLHVPLPPNGTLWTFLAMYDYHILHRALLLLSGCMASCVSFLCPIIGYSYTKHRVPVWHSGLYYIHTYTVEVIYEL